MTSRAPIICDSCIHFRPANYRNRLGPKTNTCAAFPEGIPAVILNGGDHRESIPGDAGITHQMQVGADDFFDIWFDTWERKNAAAEG
jgi:hypothetical protein